MFIPPRPNLQPNTISLEIMSTGTMGY